MPFKLFRTCMLLMVGSLALAQTQTVTLLNVSPEQNDFYRQLEADFREEFPDIELKFETMSIDAFQQTFPLSFESGDAPDLFFFDGLSGVTFNDLLQNNWIAPLAGDQEIPQSWIDRFPENTFLEGVDVKDGVIYGVPMRDRTIFGGGFLFYNRRVLEAAGLDPEASVPKTWSEVTSVCEKVTESGNSCFTASLDSQSQVVRWWAPFTSVAETGTPMNYQTGAFSFADPARLRAWELLKSLYDGGHFIPGVESTDRETSRQIFALDQAAFYVDGSWMPAVWNSMGFPDLDYGVAPIPVPDEPPYGKMAIAAPTPTLFVSSQVEHPEAAWTVVEWLTRPDGPYAQGYVGGGYGFLNYTDNAKWVDPDDEHLQKIIDIALDDYRVQEPVPLLACEDMAQSTAYEDALADTSLPEETASIVEALVNGNDWAETARTLADGRQQIFEANMKAEQEAGSSIKPEYFSYPDWAFDENFDLATYPLCN